MFGLNDGSLRPVRLDLTGDRTRDTMSAFNDRSRGGVALPRAFADNWPRSGSRVRIALFAMLLVVVAFVPVAEAQQAVSFDKSFAPSTIGPGSVSTLQFDIANSTSTPVTGLAFTDNLPAGMTIAAPAIASTDCLEAVLTAADGGGTITFSGGRIGGDESCTVAVDVTSSTAGTHTNTSGTLTSSAGSSGSASADLTVTNTLPKFSKSFAPSTVSLGGRSTLTFTVDNTLNVSGVPNLDFTDNLPIGMEIADPATATTTCGTATIPPTLTATAGTNIITLDANGTGGFPAVADGATCTVTVDVTATGAGMLDNVTEDLLAEFVSSGKASATLEVTVTPLALTKSFTDDPVPPGGTVGLDFTIENFDRAFSATGIAFSDDLTTLVPGLAGLTFSSLVSNDCGGSVSGVGGTTIDFTGGTVGPEGSCTLRVSLSVPAGATPGTYTNTTSAISGTVDSSTVQGNAASDDLFVEPVPILTKEFLDVGTLLPDPVVNAGDDVVLRFTITNTSTTSGATAVAFIDELTDGSGGFPPDLTSGFLPFPVSATLPTPDACGAGSSVALISAGTDRQALQLTGGSLAEAGMSGDSCFFDVTLSIPTDLSPGIYLNTTEEITATVDGATRTGEPASDTLTVIGAPRLTKAFTDDPVAAGGTVTLEFTLTHRPDAIGDATGISFTDDLAPVLAGLTATGLPLTEACDPDGLGGDPGTGTLSESGGVLTFLGGTLSPGESCAFGVTLAVPSDAAAGSYTNTTSPVGATVGGLAVTAPQATDDLEVQGLALTKEFTDDPAIAGGTVILRYSIANTSASSNAADIYFRDDLDSALDDLEATTLPTVTDCGTNATLTGLVNSTILEFAGGSLAFGESCTFDVVLQVPAGAADGTYKSITNLFSATFDGTPTVFDNARDDLTVLSDFLLLAKEFTDDPVAPGDTVTLEFTLSNIGGEQITDIGFTDDLVGALPGLSSSSGTQNNVCGAGSSIGGTTLLTFSGGTLDPGTSCTFSVTVSVDISVANGTVATNTVSNAQGVLGGQTVFADEATADLVIADPRDVPLTIESIVVAPEPSFEGQTVAVSATFTGGAGGTQCTVDYGDGSGPVAGSIAGSVCTGPDHVYGDNGAYPVTVTVTETTETDSETASHTVNNVAPTVSAPAMTPPLNEGSAVTASAIFSDPGFNDSPFTCTVDYGDGAGAVPGTVAGAVCTGPAHTYGDNGAYTVTIVVTDKDQGAGSNAAVHTVDNVPPTVSAPVITPEPSDEGDAVTASATFTDPGFDDTPFTCTVDYGDGAGAVPGTVDGLTCNGPSHTYGDNGSFTVTVAVTDKDNGTGSESSAHLVNNLDPTVTLDTTGAVSFPGGDAFIGRQGVPQEHQADGDDPGSDDLTFWWDFSVDTATTTYYNDTGDPSGSPDGLPSSGGTYPFSVTDTATVTFVDPGAFTVSVDLEDDDGGSDGPQSSAKLVTGDQICVRGQGFWKHQFKSKKPHFDAETLQSYLDFVDQASSVFSELVPLHNAADAKAVLKDGGSKRDKALSHTLAAWLNIASGAASVDDVIDFGGGSTATVLDVMYMIEDILLDPNASHADLVDAKNLAEAVNGIVNPDCDESSFEALFNYGIEVEFANGCWVAYIPSPDDCIDCGGKFSETSLEPVGREMSRGDLLLPGSAKGGGASCSAFGSTYLKILDNRLEWQISNTGSETLTVDRITIYWPSEYGDLRKITLRHVTIFDHVIGPASTTIDAGWRGYEMDRQIEPGATKKLKLEFGNARESERRDRRPE